MQTTTQHSSPIRCPVYLHPAACTSPEAIDKIQRQTGLLVIATTRRTAAAKPVELGPFGGDAA
ncbi:hypothetical protein Q8O96_25025 [Pseudomonas sp. LPH60]|uniref:hypothetical protein n=1 Tax=Pseudomonas sp. LPH60 TaxID=3065906 RepID=UPI00273AB21C|nr:hypothetical protein [Pseudomonas sp. LPH60]MDP4572342.1 hypothetical protein [Pseudomonas sp. LPH60]